MRQFTIIPETSDGHYIGANEHDVVRPDRAYMHGELQTHLGYDIFSLLKSELSPHEIDEHWVSDQLAEGQYLAKCIGKECTFFRWYGGRGFLGLVVQNDDQEAYEYAKQCFTEKTSSI
jgi:hypothetical protein